MSAEESLMKGERRLKRNVTPKPSQVPFFVCNIEALLYPETATYTCFGVPLPYSPAASLANYNNIDCCICIANIALVFAPFLALLPPPSAPLPPPPPPLPLPPPLSPIFSPSASPIDNTINSLAEIFPTVDDSVSCKKVFDLLKDLFVRNDICLGVRSIDHPDVLSEKINFSALGGPKSAKFDPGHLDPIYFEVGNFSASPNPPYISKNAQMC